MLNNKFFTFLTICVTFSYIEDIYGFLDGKYTAPDGEAILTKIASQKLRPNEKGSLNISGYSRISTGAFCNRNDIKTVDISGLVSIGDRVLSHCDNLESVTFSGEIKYIGRAVCYNCPKLNNVAFPECVQFIDKYAFHRCPQLDRKALMANFTNAHGLSSIYVNKDIAWYKRGLKRKLHKEQRKIYNTIDFISNF